MNDDAIVDQFPRLTGMRRGTSDPGGHSEIQANNTYLYGREEPMYPKKKHVIYLSGPMCGQPGLGFSAFDAARDYFMELGYEVLSPADLMREHKDTPIDSDPNAYEKALFLNRGIIRSEANALLQADIVIMLPGWQESVGASAEEKLARWAGIQVLEYVG